MYKHYHNRFQTDVLIIHPGEYFASADDIIISTVLGSCVAVALYDKVRHMGGLNHFMLANSLQPEEALKDTQGRYGMYAMELLINELFKMGSRKHDLIAKVFGGAAVLQRKNINANNISNSNVAFALKFLEMEQIPILKKDVGGTEARKIFFYPTTSKVLLKRIVGNLVKPIEEEEESYLKQIKKETEKGGEVTFF
ncbi:MAG: chemotaxis protein CheD [Spirochaetales bacterium]|nr:chemotaxis protein CheD [Spirochaetales bacterium]